MWKGYKAYHVRGPRFDTAACTQIALRRPLQIHEFPLGAIHRPLLLSNYQTFERLRDDSFFYARVDSVL